jgi:hypothetical protein
VLDSVIFSRPVEVDHVVALEKKEGRRWRNRRSRQFRLLT